MTTIAIPIKTAMAVCSWIQDMMIDLWLVLKNQAQKANLVNCFHTKKTAVFYEFESLPMSLGIKNVKNKRKNFWFAHWKAEGVVENVYFYEKFL